MKYPILIVGIVLFAIYLTRPETKEYWKRHHDRFIPNTCRAVADRVEKKAPSNWKMECPGTVRLILTIESQVLPNQGNARQVQYKELANSLLKLAQLSNLETLEYLKVVEVHLNSDKLKIFAKTDGQALVELSKKRSQKAIAQHLKLTVKVKEN